MINDTKQSWKECEYAVKCYGDLTDYHTCINEQILGLKSFPTILLRRGYRSFVNSAVLLNHTYMTLEDRLNGEKSKTLERTLQREMDKKLSICKACRCYEPRAKSSSLNLIKNLQIKNILKS